MAESQATSQRCGRCIIPANFPGVTFDAEGICSLCREFEHTLPDAAAARLVQLEETFSRLAGQGREYDAVVAYSGGKDSSWLLWLMVKRWNLRCLAVTIDNGFVAPEAFDNARAVTDSLGVDHIIHKPAFSFLSRLYGESVVGRLHVPAAAGRASDICNSCISLINNIVLRTAIHHGVALIAGGYIAGQVPRNSSIMVMPYSVLDAGAKQLRGRWSARLGPEVERYIGGFPGDGTMTIANPLLAISYSEDAALTAIAPLGWRRPTTTGLHSSNCRLNDLGIVAHMRRHGFHPYVAELAEQVRRGSLSREEGLLRVNSLPDLADEIDSLRRLGLKAEDLS